MTPHSRNEEILALFLVGALFLCHGVFGSLHLICTSPECVDGAGHPTGHHSAAGTMGHTQGHQVGHASGAEYFAVVAGLLGLLASMLSKGTWPKKGLGLRRDVVFRRAPAVFRPPRAPTSRVLQVFRL